MKQRISLLIRVYPLLALIMFTLGFRQKYVAIPFALLAIWYIWHERKGLNEPPAAESVCWLTVAVLAFGLFIAVLVGGHHVAKFNLGKQGVDFAIFTHVIQSIATGDSGYTTITGSTANHFLSHHFSPVFYGFGLLSSFGELPPHLTLIIGLMGSIFLLILACGMTIRGLGCGKFYTLCLLIAILLSPSVRGGVLWSVHDETLATGLLALAVALWLKGAWGYAGMAFAGTLLFKETFALVYACWIPVAYVFGSRQPDMRRNVSLLILWSLALLVLLAHYFVIPRFLGSSFSVSDRLVSPAQLADPSELVARAWYMVTICYPLLFVRLRNCRSWEVLILAMAFIGLSLLSSFEGMYAPFNYYALNPTVILGVWILFNLRGLSPYAISALCTAILAVGFWAYPGERLGRNIGRGFFASRFEYLPVESVGEKVIAGDFDLVYLIQRRFVYREWVAERLAVDWEYYLVRHGQQASSTLMRDALECGEIPQYKIYCKSP